MKHMMRSTYGNDACVPCCLMFVVSHVVFVTLHNWSHLASMGSARRRYGVGGAALARLHSWRSCAHVKSTQPRFVHPEQTFYHVCNKVGAAIASLTQRWPTNSAQARMQTRSKQACTQAGMRRRRTCSCTCVQYPASLLVRL